MMSTNRSPLDERARDLLPLSPVMLQILLALADRDRHGLGIAEHIEHFTGGRTSLGPGTLYGALKRMLEANLIGEGGGPPTGDRDDPRRRYYQLTALGRRALELETRELSTLIDVARAKKVFK